MDERIRSERDQSHTRESANPPGAKQRLATTDMSNEQPCPTYEGYPRDEALVIAREVRRTWEAWRRTSFSEWAGLMLAVAQVVRRRQDELARPQWP